MRFPGAYFHVYVFAAFFIGFALAVANDPAGFERKFQPTVREVAAVTGAAEDYVHNSRLWQMADETVELFKQAIRLPTTLLERVSDALENARKRQARNAGDQEEPSRSPAVEPAARSQA